MRMIAEYLDKALDFERLAAAESDAPLKTRLLAQAMAYRKLAADRAKKQGVPFPPHPAGNKA